MPILLLPYTKVFRGKTCQPAEGSASIIVRRESCRRARAATCRTGLVVETAHSVCFPERKKLDAYRLPIYLVFKYLPRIPTGAKQPSWGVVGFNQAPADSLSTTRFYRGGHTIRRPLLLLPSPFDDNRLHRGIHPTPGPTVDYCLVSTRRSTTHCFPGPPEISSFD